MKTKDIYKQPGHLIRRAHQMATAIFMEEVNALELTPVQFSALIVICEHPGTDATRVSDLIFFDRSTIGNVLDRLEKKRLIARRPGRQDRRTKRLFLRPQGRAVLRKVAAKAPKIAERIFASVSTSERASFVELLGRLISTNGRGSKKSSLR
jgi:MarR family transcriptional regulator, lower aerobic nicotinate degradation pathway regulator